MKKRYLYLIVFLILISSVIALQKPNKLNRCTLCTPSIQFCDGLLLSNETGLYYNNQLLNGTTTVTSNDTLWQNVSGVATYDGDVKVTGDINIGSMTSENNISTVKINKDDRGMTFEYNGTAQSVQIINNGTGTSNNALNVVSYNPNETSGGFNGYEKDRGTVKIVHFQPQGLDDSTSSALSLELKGGTTESQGIFIKTWNSTGDIIHVSNGTSSPFVVESDGGLTITTENVYGLLVQDTDLNDMFRVDAVSGLTRTRKHIPIANNTYSSGEDIFAWRNITSTDIFSKYIKFDSKGLNNEIIKVNAFDGSRLFRTLETGGGHGWLGVSDSSGNEDWILRSDGGDSVYNAGELCIGASSCSDKVYINGNLRVDGNINVSGCIIYNGGTLGSCI